MTTGIVRDTASIDEGEVARGVTGGVQHLDPCACDLQRLAGEQVAGQLFGRETIEGHVLVESPDHPFAEGPNLAIVVEVNSVCQISRSLRNARRKSMRTAPVLFPSWVASSA